MVKQLPNLFLLPKHKIISRSGDIRTILKTGNKIHGKSLNLFYKTASAEMFAVLTPKRIGKAHQRNKMKRLVRELYRKNPQWFEQRHVLIFVKYLNFNYTSLLEELGKMVIKE